MFSMLQQLIVAAKQSEEESGFTRFLTKPVIAGLVVVGCFIFTRISSAILLAIVKRIADRTATNAARWWRN
ncbi:MAG: hypothetical protein ACKOFM_08850, partial [Actinomycetota bacterium]